MSAEPLEPPRRRSFTDASPREIRAALIPEEQVEFDITWRAALTTAEESLDLTEVYSTLDTWRIHAEITEDLGHRSYRELLARAERIARTEERPPGTVPLADVKALLRERLGL
jgi:hypothetical protein